MDDGGNIMSDAKTVVRDGVPVMSDGLFSMWMSRRGPSVLGKLPLSPSKTPAERAQMFSTLRKPTG